MLVAAQALAATRWVDRHYSAGDGLPVNTLRGAAIDRDGFLWLATYDGLVRFDGAHFDLFDRARVASMDDNRMLAIYRDRGGRVYAVSERGEWLAVTSTGVTRVALAGKWPPVRHVDRASLCLTTPRALYCPDGHGGFPQRVTFPATTDVLLALPDAAAIWMVTRAGVVWRWQGAHWRQLATIKSGPETRDSRIAEVGADGSLWFAFDRRLWRVTRSGVLTKFAGADAPIDGARLRRDPSGALWIGAGNGVFRVEDGEPRRVFGDSKPPAVEWHASWRAPDGALWLARDGSLWRVRTLPARGAPLPAPVLAIDGTIVDLLFGDNGTVWVITRRDGLHRLTRARVEVVGARAGDAGLNVFGVARDRAGTMWLGTLGSGLVSIDADGRRHRFDRGEGLSGPNAWVVAAAPDGGVVAATYAPGLWRRGAGGGPFVAVSLPPALVAARVYAIRFDAAGNLWLGTADGVWQRRDGHWRKRWPLTATVATVRALAFAASGAIFAGGDHGVWRIDGPQPRQIAASAVAHGGVRGLFVDRGGALWISTDGSGLVRVAADDPDGLKARRIGRTQGLPSNTPRGIAEDAAGNLWVNSNQGIFRIAKDDLGAFLAGARRRLSPLLLGLADGVASLEGNGGVQPAVARDARGRLWFPTQSGAVVFDPATMPLRKTPPVAVIDSLASRAGPLTPGADGELPLGVRNLVVHYGAASLHAGGAVRFRYRLWPQDSDWIEAGDGRSVRYANLDPGGYRFEVLAGNSDGYWASQPTVLAFSVPRFWYETWWFRLLMLALALVALALAWKWRERRLQQRAALLDGQVLERTAELAAEKDRVEATLSKLSAAHRALEATHHTIADSNQRLADQARRLEALDRFRRRVLADVSHELRTPIMLVSLPMRELAAHAGALGKTDRRHLDLSLKHLDRLAALIEQLVGLVQAESGQIRLAMARLDPAKLLADIVAGFEPAATEAKAVVELDTGGAPHEVYGDRERLVTVFGNLIDNALKHAPAGSVVKVVVAADEEHAIVIISDAGGGFDPANAERLFERFFRADDAPSLGREGLGIGLALARELVELHGGSIRASSVPGHGATFRVQLPLGSAHVAIDELALDAPASAGLPAPQADGGGGRVLLVEDHPDLAAYLAERLGEHLPVTCVGSAEAGLAALDAEPAIQLVVSDVVLPGRSGLELCREVAARADGRARPVILISAKAAAADREAGLAAGASAYLAKPFSFETLLDAVLRAWPAVAARLAPTPADPETLDPLLALAGARLGDARFGVAAWAECAHLSPRQLRRRVNEASGQSPQAWLLEQRLLRVRRLIRDGRCRTLAEAGAHCGMNNASYLYRSYHARFGEA